MTTPSFVEQNGIALGKLVRVMFAALTDGEGKMAHYGRSAT
jgi:hypothetical protein